MMMLLIIGERAVSTLERARPAERRVMHVYGRGNNAEDHPMPTGTERDESRKQ